MNKHLWRVTEHSHIPRLPHGRRKSKYPKKVIRSHFPNCIERFIINVTLVLRNGLLSLSTGNVSLHHYQTTEIISTAQMDPKDQWPTVVLAFAHVAFIAFLSYLFVS